MSKTPKQLETEIDRTLHPKGSRVNLTTCHEDVGRRSVRFLVDHDTLGRLVAKGDYLAGFDGVWGVKRVARNGHLTIARVAGDPRDPLNKTILVDDREVAPHELTHMKRLP